MKLIKQDGTKAEYFNPDHVLAVKSGQFRTAVLLAGGHTFEMSGDFAGVVQTIQENRSKGLEPLVVVNNGQDDQKAAFNLARVTRLTPNGIGGTMLHLDDDKTPQVGINTPHEEVLSAIAQQQLAARSFASRV